MKERNRGTWGVLVNSRKRLALASVVAFLLAAFAACGQAPGGDGAQQGGAAASQGQISQGGAAEEQADGSEGATPAEGSAEATEAVGTGNGGEISHPLRYVVPGNQPPDYQNGMDAVNAKLAADGVGVAVSAIHIPWDAYEQKLNLMLSGGEEFEMLHVMQDVKNISSLASRDALIPVEEYIDSYTELRDHFNDVAWSAATYNGQRYAIPADWRSWEQPRELAVRQDILEKVAPDGWPDGDIEGILKLMKDMQVEIEAQTGIKAYHQIHNLSGSTSWTTPMHERYPYQTETSLGMVMCFQDGTIESFYESPEFKQNTEIYKRMYDEGLLNPDILNFTPEIREDAVRIGAFLPSDSYTYSSFVVMEQNVPGAKGELYAVNSKAPSVVRTLIQNLNAISATAEDPNSPLKFLTWLYHSQENHDLFHYGIEGVHYTAPAPQRIEIARDEGGNPLFENATWMSGYLPFIRYDMSLPDKGVEWWEYKSDNAVVSPLAGFVFDSAPVASELTALQTEIISSIYPLAYGLVAYEDGYEQAISRMKAAGLDRYVEEFRRQFDEYKAANPSVVG
ncbi:MAG: extracellular solute-binding protein [Clostridiales bacterium]|jgi:putative aldouronate transport system substrate-binding protein|nr:extracellular solute-binding protein [Clostridiales bacterium]